MAPASTDRSICCIARAAGIRGERKWMGYERKRGKLNDLNKLLLGQRQLVPYDRGRSVAACSRSVIVITLDTDTQLPRDTAAKMVAAMAHPLNQPILDPETKTGDRRLRAVAPAGGRQHRLRAALLDRQIFSGQPGFDPYSTSVSDVYHDLHGAGQLHRQGHLRCAGFSTPRSASAFRRTQSSATI